MTELDLDPELGIFDKRRLFSDRAIWAFVFIGLAVVVTAMTGLWSFSGYLVDPWSGSRILVALIAAIYGLVLGWMIFPRLGRRFE